MMKVLNGTAIGIVVGLIPNAIFGELFRALASVSPVFGQLAAIVSGAQFVVPALVGALVGVQFAMNGMEIAVLAATTFIGSGVLTFSDEAWTIAGIGDLINTIIVASLGALALRWLHGKLGSVTIIVLPLIVVTAVGGIGWVTLPYSRAITGGIGRLIAHFTELQPLLMCILLAIAFAIIIVSPISTVAVALAVGIDGLASGAANIGIAAATMTLCVGSIRQHNKSGVTLAVFLGSMKMFMPNWITKPVMNIPLILNAAIAGVTAWAFHLQGTAQSAGFGFSGLVGPIAAYKFLDQAPLVRLGILFLAFFVITAAGALLIDFLFTRVLKLYTNEVFKFPIVEE